VGSTGARLGIKFDPKAGLGEPRGQGGEPRSQGREPFVFSPVRYLAERVLEKYYCLCDRFLFVSSCTVHYISGPFFSYTLPMRIIPKHTAACLIAPTAYLRRYKTPLLQLIAHA
jgi:hypothetical protein